MHIIIKVAAKGGPGSGNWAHSGRPGKRGGSMLRSVSMSLATGRDWLERYERVAGKPHKEKPEYRAEQARERQKLAEAERRRVESVKRSTKPKRTSYAKPDSYEAFDAFDIPAKSKQKLHKGTYEQKGKIVVAKDGTLAANFIARPDYPGLKIRPKYDDISNYAGIDNTTAAKFDVRPPNGKASALIISTKLAGTGKMSRSKGARRDAVAELNIRKAIKKLLEKGAPPNMLLEWTLDTGRTIIRPLSEWL